ncbi:bacteriohemerythrin [Megalodesulfovibrio paquesii]
MSLAQRILGLIVLLSMVVAGMFIATWLNESGQKTDSQIINLAGRQRMLVQRIARDCLHLAHTPAEQAAPIKTSLDTSIRLFDVTHQALSQGGAAPSTLDPHGVKVDLPAPSSAAAALLQALGGPWLDFRRGAQELTPGASDISAKATGLVAPAEALVGVLNKVVAQLEAENDAKMGQLMWIEWISVALIAGLLAVLALLLRRQVLLPLARLVDYSNAVASGRLDVTLAGQFTHELRVLARSVTSMVDSLHTAMTSCTEQELAAKTAHAETNAALREARTKEAALEELLATITTVSASAAAHSEKVSLAIEELSREIHTVDQGVELQRDRMTETATAVEEMNATVMEVARNAGRAATNAAASKKLASEGAAGVNSAVEGIRQMQHRILGLKESMARLGVDAENIGRIMNVISDIADQTNLLALNAAIEAARAGDAGRGFAVVADEVRKLAEKTMQATREVGTAISTIQETARMNVAAVDTAASNIIAATEQAAQAGASMGDIVSIVEDTAGQVESIATAAEEQSAVSEEINRAVSEVTAVATDTAKNMQRSAKALTRIITIIEDLNGAMQDLSRHAQANKSGGAQGTSAVSVDNRELLSWTPKLSTTIDSIDEEHKVLVRLINELHAAMRDNKDRHILGGILDQLKDYAVTHFQHEEAHFARHNYPDAEAHIAQHQKFLAAVMDFYREFQSGRATVTLDLMRFLKDWLQGHIIGVDKKYGPYLKSKGVR